MSDTVHAESASERPAPARSARGRQIMALVLIVLVLLLGLSSFLLYRLAIVPKSASTASRAGQTSDGLVWIRSIYGTSNNPKDLFGQTVAAVPGVDGSLWVTDAKAGSIMHFTADGRYLGAVRSADASTPLQMPSRLAVGPDGLIYACETALDAIRVLRPDGTDAGSFTIPKPVSIAVSKDRIAVGTLYGLAILQKTGEPIKVIGSRGKGEGEFDYVHGIALDDADNVYVTDSYNNRVGAYDKNGKKLWMIRTGPAANDATQSAGMLAPREETSSPLKGADQLQLPLGLTIDAAGRVVVIDMYDCALAVFDGKTGRFIGKYGEGGADDGQFFYPVSVSYDRSHDWFSVADAFNKRIEIVRIPGSAGGGVGVAAAAQRALASPWRACLFPLLLLLIAIVAGLVVRARGRRRAAREAQPDEAAARIGEQSADEAV